jgi:hypothetical protein
MRQLAARKSTLLFASVVSSGHHRFDVFGKQTHRLCFDGQGNGSDAPRVRRFTAPIAAAACHDRGGLMDGGLRLRLAEG